MNILIWILRFSLLHICSSKREYTKYFTRNVCDESPKKIYKYEAFYLIWNGHNRPNLCKYYINSPYMNDRICFRSQVYNFKSISGDIKLQIRNATGSTWIYDKLTTSIEKQCVIGAHKLEFAIKIGPGYIPPQPAIYLKLFLTSETYNQFASKSEDMSDAAFSAIGAIIFFIGAFWFINKKNINVYKICECLGELFCYCLTCKCLGGCCSSIMRRIKRNPRNNESDEDSVEMDDIHPPPSHDDNDVTTPATDESAEPPSYETALVLYVPLEPTGEPPSYEEVCGVRDMPV